jgi:N-methylhydantoinase B
VQRPDGSVTRVPPKGATEVVHRGDVIRLQPAAGGGYGNPRERARDAVLGDVADGYVSGKAARDLYGVDVDEGVAR